MKHASSTGSRLDRWTSQPQSVRVAATLLLAGLLIPSAMLASQTPLPRQMQPARDGSHRAAPATGSLRGRIVAADGGRPIKRAVVRVESRALSMSRAAITGSDGSYELSGLSEGDYTVVASKEAFVSLEYGQTRYQGHGSPIHLTVGAVVDHVDFALPRGGVVTGSVVDESGEPMVGATVSSLRSRFSLGQRRLIPSNSAMARTDDLGQFRVYGLEPGRYVLMATVTASLVTDDEHNADGFAPTYFPSGDTPGQARPLTFIAGQTIDNVDLVMRLGRKATIAGIAVDSQGLVMASCQVTLQKVGGSLSSYLSAGQTDADGAFEIKNVEPGQYIVIVKATRGERLEIASARLSVNGSDVFGLRVASLPNARLEGRIIADGEGSAPAPSDIRIVATPESPDEVAAERGTVARNNFSFSLNITAQPIFIRAADKSGNWFVKSITVRGVDFTDSPIDLSRSLDLTDIQISLTKRPSRLTGTIQNWTSAQGPFVMVVFAKNQERWSYLSRYIKVGRSDQDGRVAIVGLPAGEYYAAAIDVLEDGDEGDPEFLRGLVSRARTLTIAEDEVKDILLPPGRS